MLTKLEVIRIAQETLRIEARSLNQAAEKIADNFYHSVKIIANCQGRIIVTGIGKSANIANKIVATFNSTGTPSVFMHASEALHGDLGVLLTNDVVICISNSGNSPEIKLLIPFIKQRGNQIIAIVGNQQSFLAQHANYIIDSSVENEASLLVSAPTCSTTVQLGIGDALAVSLMELKGFTKEDFYNSHPGGSIGKKLSIKVKDIATNNEKPQVAESAKLQEIIYEISSKRIGATAVCEHSKVIGIITDGDIRRMLGNELALSKITAKDIMSLNPKTILSNSLAIDAFRLMNQNNITQIIVVDDANSYFGMVHLHDLISEGLTEE